MPRRWHLSKPVGSGARALLIPGRKRVPSIRNSKVSGPEEELSLACLKNIRKASWAGRQKGRGESLGNLVRKVTGAGCWDSLHFLLYTL